MNWKNVLFLVGVERKSGRLIRGQRLTRYRESKFSAYLFYIIAIGLGVGIGGLIGNGYHVLIEQNSPDLVTQYGLAVLSFFLSLPTLVLVYSLVFTMLSQIQRSGVKTTTQVPYWLPITWQEHTLASVLSNLLGFPLISIAGISAGIISFGSLSGLIVPAILTSLAMIGAGFMASATTEILRILQVRFIGAIYKTSGRAAVWVRFVGSLIFFLLFYVAYFAVIYGSGALTFIQVIASTQNLAWFVPFVWLGIMLYNFTSGLLLQGFFFMAISLLFILGLFFLAVWLNGRFGLYEPPAITVTRGVYSPKTGLLGRLGFSTTEAALVRKDLKAFTRRRELMTIFIGPIVFVLVPLMQSIGSGNSGVGMLAILWVWMTFLLPASIMAMSLGNLIVGEEGMAVWQIYASPFSAKSFVKSKYSLLVFFALLVLVITGTVGSLLYTISLRTAVIATFEALFLSFAIGAVSLSSGLKGADFNELPRARMIRVEWAFINLIACILCGVAILAPLVPFVFSSLIPGIHVPDALVLVGISGLIAVVISLIFYRVCLKNARDLLSKAEV